MRKELKILIIIILVLLVIVITRMIVLSKKEKPNTNTTKHGFDNETGEYVLYDNNGNEIERANDEDALKIYEYNSDYDPKLPLEESGIDVKSYKSDN